MRTAALIVAAGMSSRMGQFKPMLNIGSITIAQRVVDTFRQAGIRKIVMVTGYNAVMLERHLAGSDVIFLRNDRYETTQMFDSVKIGLAYLQEKCDRVLFTPVDIPLFTSRTVMALLACSSARMYYVPVEDPGTLYDADTPVDYSTLVERHNSQPVFPGERSCALEE